MEILNLKNSVDEIIEKEINSYINSKKKLEEIKQLIINFMVTEDYINVNGKAISDNYSKILEIIRR